MNKNDSYIAFGANATTQERTPSKTILDGISSLTMFGIHIEVQSHLYQTPCFPAGAGPDYINGVAQVSCPIEMSAQALLKVLHKVEAQFGRTRETRWGMRTLDLDLLSFNDLVMPSLAQYHHWRNLPLDRQMQLAPDDLILPHPRIQDRAFVMVPLTEIAPNWRHPVLQKTAQELCNALPEDARRTVMAGIIPKA